MVWTGFLIAELSPHETASSIACGEVKVIVLQKAKAQSALPFSETSPSSVSEDTSMPYSPYLPVTATVAEVPSGA